MPKSRVPVLLASLLLAPVLMATSMPVPPLDSGPPPLVGRWTPTTRSCENHAAITYDWGGHFRTKYTRGVWTLQGTTLTMFTTYRDSPGQRAQRFKPQTPERRTLRLDGDRMTQRWADGSLHHFRRCR